MGKYNFDISKKYSNFLSAVSKITKDEKNKRITASSGLAEDIVEISVKTKPTPVYSKIPVCNNHISAGGICLTPEYTAKEYITTNDGLSTYNPHYYIDKLWASKKGEGTTMVQSVVLRSLEDAKTSGRVMLDATNIDGQTAPGAFYYKLGFRFTNPASNTLCENWISNGGKFQDAPFLSGLMYLPKENIEHCITYGLKETNLEYMQKILENYRKLGLF